MLNMRIMTWNRDSQGLFDYETRHCQKQKVTTDKSSKLIREAKMCCLQDPAFDVASKLGSQAQVIFNIKKIRNHYMIEPSELEKIATLTPEEKKKFMIKDVDQCYAESGEQLNDPIDTFEKIYLIVRNLSDRNEKLQYELKKLDIIKLGRVKFKVK